MVETYQVISNCLNHYQIFKKWQRKDTLVLKNILTTLCYYTQCPLTLSLYFLYVKKHQSGDTTVITWYVSTVFYSCRINVYKHKKYA